MKNENQNSKLTAKEVFSWIRILLTGAALALFINFCLVVNAQVPTGSMENTIHVGDRVMGNRLAYLFSSPERGDIAIFRLPDDESKLYIKRIIGLPGDTVEIREGKVYLNDNASPLEEPYLLETPTGNFGPYLIPEGHYFMLGDNRENSLDSRYWDRQFVPRKNILAKAEFCYYPHPYWME